MDLLSTQGAQLAPKDTPEAIAIFRARGMLQFHHAHAYALGGVATLGNIQLRCRAHNALAAEQDYGRAFMRKRIDDSPRGVLDAWDERARPIGSAYALTSTSFDHAQYFP